MDNRNYEIDLLKLYKDGKITQYVLEKEIGNYLGERVIVKVVKCFHHTARTFIVFPAAEIKENGIYLNVYIDEGSLLEALTAEEMFNVLKVLKENIQSIYRNYMSFISSSAANSLTVTEVLVEYLKQYMSLIQFFEVVNDRTKKVLHSVASLDEIIENLDNGRAAGQDLEELIIKDYIPREVLDLSKSISEKSGGELGLFRDLNRQELPIGSVCNYEIRKYAEHSINIDNYRKIPHDYYPSTNQ